MKILFLHHHVRGGGVTRVLASQIRALQGQHECRLWTGDAQPPHDFDGLSFDYQALAELDYLDRGRGSAPWARMEQLLYARLHGAVQQGWLIHSHNSSLGKNPLVTWVLYRLALEGAPILFQHHDFAEDGRPANYRGLQQVLQDRSDASLADMLYPGMARCLHVALNSRDRGFLANLPHLSAANVHLLPNAIDTPACPPTPQVDAAAFRNSLHLRAQGELWTYPVRGIRRKNLGEFALLAALFTEHDYLLTLAPQNPLEAETYNIWADQVHRLKLPLHVNAGAHWPFEEIMAQSDGVVTTSIREGFGLAFLEPWTLGKAVTGRDLPDITQDFKAHGIVLNHFYTRLDIPLNASEQKVLSDAYRAYAHDYSDAMGLSTSVEVVEHIVKDKVGPWTDFAALDRQAQMDLVARVIVDPRLAAQIRQRNGWLDGIWSVSSERVEHNRRQIHRHYGLRQYGATLAGLYQQLAERPVGPCPPRTIDNPMLQNFFHPDHFHLLRK